MTKSEGLSAHSLLDQFLELRGLSPDFDDWTEERFASNPPRLYRLRQLVALFRAFGLPWNPRGFTEGEFIQPDNPRYAGLWERLQTQLPTHRLERAGPHQFPHFFGILYRHRELLDRALSARSEWLEASGLYAFALRMCDSLNDVIRKNLHTLDEMLAVLINPEGIAFTREALIREYGYPDVDLFSIDADWW